MARPPLIPEIFVIPMLQLWENGNNAQQIADWLKINHNLEVRHQVVSARIKKVKDIQLQAQRDAIASKASEQALDYISIMDSDILKLNRKTNRLLESDDPDDLMLAKSLIETKTKIITLQMEITGVNQPEKIEQNQDVMVDGLLDKLGKAN